MHRTLEIIDRHLETLTTMQQVRPQGDSYTFAKSILEMIKKEVQDLPTGSESKDIIKNLVMLSGKVGDKFTVNHQDPNDVPYDLCIGGGDYISITVDVDNGQILGWDSDAWREYLLEDHDDDE